MLVQRYFLKEVLLVFCLVICASICPAYCATGDYLCESHELPVGLPSAELEGTITQHSFLSSRLKDSVGELTFVNRFALPVIAVEIVIEYGDDKSQVLTQLPFLAVLPKARAQFRPPIPAEYEQRLKKPILPGHIVRIAAEGFIIMRDCPVRARLLIATVMFSNSRTQTWTAATWKTDPVLEYFPFDFDLARNAVSSFQKLLTKVTVSASGRVKNLRTIDATSSKLAELLGDQLKDWRFYPALKDGKPSDGELVLLFCFRDEHAPQDKDFGWVDPQDVAAPLVVVDLVPDSRTPGRWKAWFGRRPGGTSIELSDDAQHQPPGR